MLICTLIDRMIWLLLALRELNFTLRLLDHLSLFELNKLLNITNIPLAPLSYSRTVFRAKWEDLKEKIWMRRFENFKSEGEDLKIKYLTFSSIFSRAIVLLSIYLKSHSHQQYVHTVAHKNHPNKFNIVSSSFLFCFSVITCSNSSK